LNKSKEFAASVAKAFTLEGGVEIEEKVDLSTFEANFLIFAIVKKDTTLLLYLLDHHAYGSPYGETGNDPWESRPRERDGNR